MLSTLLSWEDAGKIEPDSCVLAGQEAGNRTRAGTDEFLVRYWEEFFSPWIWSSTGAENWRHYGIYNFGDTQNLARQAAG